MAGIGIGLDYRASPEELYKSSSSFLKLTYVIMGLSSVVAALALSDESVITQTGGVMIYGLSTLLSLGSAFELEKLDKKEGLENKLQS